MKTYSELLALVEKARAASFDFGVKSSARNEGKMLNSIESVEKALSELYEVIRAAHNQSH